MNKIIQKKVHLNVILTVLIGVQFCHQGGGGQEKKRILGGISDSFGIFFNIFKQLFPLLYLDLVSGQVEVTQQLHDFVFC